MNIGIHMTNFLFLFNNWFYYLDNPGQGAYNNTVSPIVTDNPEKTSNFISAGLKTQLQHLYDIMKIAVPVLIFVLSIVDFIVAIAGNEEQMKKATNKLIKRLIVGLLFFVIPIILDMLFELTVIGGTYLD